MTRGLSVQNLTKAFGETRVLDDVSFVIEPGEFVTIVGASGCGKSTLLRILAGLEFSDAGSVTCSSRPIEGPGVERAMVFQDYSLFPWLSVMDNVLFSRRLSTNEDDNLALERGAEEARAQNLLSLIGLSKVKSAYPSQLSGGMRQRVAIARALMSKPAVLLMDEPFGALDAQTREVMQDLVLDVVREEGTTIVFVTHDVEEAIYLGSRVVLMAPYPGRIDSIYDVALPSPRTDDIRLEPKFMELKRRITSRVRETAAASFDGADPSSSS